MSDARVSKTIVTILSKKISSDYSKIKYISKTNMKISFVFLQFAEMDRLPINMHHFQEAFKTGSPVHQKFYSTGN